MITVQIKKDFKGLDHYESRAFLNDVGNVTQNAANDTVAHIRSSWSGSSPSDPGNPPAVVTGELDRSIKVIEGRNELGQFANQMSAVSYTIIVESDYGAALEFGDPSKNLLPRPFMQPAIFWLKQSFANRFRSIFRFR